MVVVVDDFFVSCFLSFIPFCTRQLLSISEALVIHSFTVFGQSLMSIISIRFLTPLTSPALYLRIFSRSSVISVLIRRVLISRLYSSTVLDPCSILSSLFRAFSLFRGSLNQSLRAFSNSAQVGYSEVSQISCFWVTHCPAESSDC